MNGPLACQIKDYLLGVWNKSCVKLDAPTRWYADNTHRFVYLEYKGDNLYLRIINWEKDLRFYPKYDGLIDTFESFKTIWELTS